MATPEIVPVAPTIVSGNFRHLAIPSCSLTTDDLRRLYEVLEQKAREAADYQVATLQQLPGQTPEQFEQVKQNIRSSLALVVQVQGSTGEWTGSRTSEALLDSSLPDTVAAVTYDSAFLFRTQFNLHPQSSFSVNLDFTRTSILDMSAEPASNKSAGLISGVNASWVAGTYDVLHKFFDERSTARGWLHSRRAYDVAVLILGFPASFALVYRADRFLRLLLQVPDALFVAFYVYLVLIALFGFRLLFNYSKWVFPKCEGPTRRQGGPKFHKAVLLAIGGTLLSLVIETLLRMIGVPLP